jgi:hypothetical protein
MFRFFILNPIPFLFGWQDPDNGVRTFCSKYNPPDARQPPYPLHQVPVHSSGKNGHICRTPCTIPGLLHALLT